MIENFYTGKLNFSKCHTNCASSLNCIDWHLLQNPSEESLTKSEVIRGRFIGDPSYEVCSDFIGKHTLTFYTQV